MASKILIVLGCMLCCLPFLAHAFCVPATKVPILRASLFLRKARVVNRMTLAEPPTDLDRQTLTRAARMESGLTTKEIREAVRHLEDGAQEKKNEENKESMMKKLTGKWRLIWTRDDKRPHMTDFFTGGKLLYFPLNSEIEFDCEGKKIINRLHFGPFSYEMSGRLELVPEKSRIEFFFNNLKLGPLSLPIDLDFSPIDSKSNFRMIDVTDQYVLARGSFHDLSLWSRI